MCFCHTLLGGGGGGRPLRRPSLQGFDAAVTCACVFGAVGCGGSVAVMPDSCEGRGCVHAVHAHDVLIILITERCALDKLKIHSVHHDVSDDSKGAPRLMCTQPLTARQQTRQLWAYLLGLRRHIDELVRECGDEHKRRENVRHVPTPVRCARHFGGLGALLRLLRRQLADLVLS